MKYLVISHPTRGILKEESEPSIGDFRFQWSKPIGDDANWKFGTRDQAQKIIDQMPQPLANRCEIYEVTA